MGGVTSGEWPYHENAHGEWVKCGSNPCRRHSGGDIMARDAEDAYAKANAASAPSGLSSSAHDGAAGNARLVPFRRDVDELPAGSYYRTGDGSVYHVRDTAPGHHAFVKVNPVTGMEDEGFSGFVKNIGTRGVKPIQPIKPEGMDGELKGAEVTLRGDDGGEIRAVRLTSGSGNTMLLHPSADVNQGIPGILREYGFVYDGSDGRAIRCHHIDSAGFPAPSSPSSGDDGGAPAVAVKRRADGSPAEDDEVAEAVKGRIGKGTALSGQIDAIAASGYVGATARSRTGRRYGAETMRKRLMNGYDRPSSAYRYREHDDPVLIGAQMRMLDSLAPDQPSDDWEYEPDRMYATMGGDMRHCSVLRKGSAFIMHEFDESKRNEELWFVHGSDGFGRGPDGTYEPVGGILSMSKVAGLYATGSRP